MADSSGSTGDPHDRIALKKGPAKEDATGAVVREGLLLASLDATLHRRRKRGATFPLKTAILAMLLLAAAAGAGHLYRTLNRVLPAKRLALDAEHLEQYERDFNSSAAQLQRDWKMCTDTVKDAFVMHFIPRKRGAAVPVDAFSLYEKHIHSVRAFERPAATAKNEEKLVYALQLRLMTSICTAASSRLSSLQELDEYGRTRPDFPIPLLGHQVEPLTRYELYQQKETVSFPSFVAMLGGRDVNLKHQRKAAGQKIPEVLAHRLVNVLHADDLLDRSDREAHAAFTDFMEAATGELPLPGSVKTDPNSLPVPARSSVFPIDLFREALFHAKKLREDQYVYPGDAGCWAKDWTINGVLRVVDELEDQAISRILKSEGAKLNALEAWTEGKDRNVRFDDVFSLSLALL